MNRRIGSAISLLAVFAISACTAEVFPNNSKTIEEPGEDSRGVPRWIAKGLAKPACPQIVAQPTCLALVESSTGVSDHVAGWTPRDFQTRYKLPSSTKGKGQIVAIVDAYDNPKVASDLATYRKHFTLGAADFTKYNQEGKKGHYPKGNQDWGFEIDLDVEMVSAACPKCTIYLIEANGFDGADLDAAEVEAVKLGAHIVSNSWICFGSNSCVDPADFDSPGVVYLAASGDEGYNKNGAPESFASVISVGGTLLSKGRSGYNETVWDGSGGGCSNNGAGAGVAKPPWQHDPSCAYRTDVDVAAVAWYVAAYDSYGSGGWSTSGGTSAATQLNAAVFGLAGNAGSQNAAERFWKVTQHERNDHLNYISSGNDGSCDNSYLCTAGTHQFKTYAGPTGWGTPEGIDLY